MTMADKIVVLRAGRVEQVGTPLDLYNEPANRFVAGFIGSPKMNFFEGALQDVQDGHATVRIPDLVAVRLPIANSNARTGDQVVLGVRPEHLVVGGGGDVDVTVQVALTEQLGDETFIYGALPGGETLVIRAPGQNAVRADQPLRVGLRLDACHLFGAEEKRLSPGTR
jgi:ABC-type sugar transport system ATPase subunit